MQLTQTYSYLVKLSYRGYTQCMSTNKKRPGGSVRIIGGDLRSRKINFPDAAGLRPSADRVRETLFNWLQPAIPAARVLDLFAGSGALGFEAASRGASSVVMVEKAKIVASALRDNRDALAAGAVQIIEADAFSWLARQAGKSAFDIVFVDPPFDANWQAKAAHALAESGCLAAGALVYIESAEALDAAALPANWTERKTKRAGAVHSTLLQAT